MLQLGLPPSKAMFLTKYLKYQQCRVPGLRVDQVICLKDLIDDHRIGPDRIGNHWLRKPMAFEEETGNHINHLSGLGMCWSQVNNLTMPVCHSVDHEG